MGRLLVKILVITILCTYSLPAQNLLQYKLKIGDSLTIQQHASQNIVQNEKGDVHKISNDLEENYTFKVTSKTDSSYILNFKFNRFKLKTTSDKFGVLVDVDTNKPVKKDDTEGKIFSGLTKSNLEIEMSKSGKINRVSGTEQMINTMIGLGGVNDEFTKQLMIESMKSQFGSETLSKSFEQLTHIYPKNKVKVGDSWTNEFNGEFKSKNNWTLKKVTDTIYLNANASLKMVIKDENTNLLLKGNQNISVKASKQTGFINEMIVNSEACTPTDVKLPNTNPTKITSKTTYKIK